MCVILRTNAKIEAKKKKKKNGRMGFLTALPTFFEMKKRPLQYAIRMLPVYLSPPFSCPFLCHCLPNRGSLWLQTTWYSTWCTVGGFRWMCHDSIVASNLSHWGVTCVDTIFVLLLLFNRYPLLHCDLIIAVMKLFRILFNTLSFPSLFRHFSKN